MIETKVRLSRFEIDAISAAFGKHFLPSDHLWLFGSRVDLQQRGGDIDLYIETTLAPDEIYKCKLEFVLDICDQIGDQKIDVVINIINISDSLPIYDRARSQGVQLQ